MQGDTLKDMNNAHPAAGSLVHVIATKLEALHSDVGDMKGVLRELTSAVAKLAIVEERQSQASLALERAFKVLEKTEGRHDALEKRVDVLEKAQPLQQQATDWIKGGVWSAVCIVMIFIAKKAGLM